MPVGSFSETFAILLFITADAIMSLCNYKDIFGAPGTGIHEARIGGLAFWDLAGTLCLIFIIIVVLVKKYSIGVLKAVLTTVASVTATTVAAHWLFCVDTAGMKMISQ